MATNRKIQNRPRLGLSQKTAIEPLLRALHRHGVQFLSTGGTHDFICSLGLPCERVEDLTGYPSILGGRVKTLHPKVFGGILGRRDLADDVQQMAQYEIGNIDLVIVDLYPSKTLWPPAPQQPTSLRKLTSAAFRSSAPRPRTSTMMVESFLRNRTYAPLLEIVEARGAETTLDERRGFATRAFATSSHYDTAIHDWFEKA